MSAESNLLPPSTHSAAPLALGLVPVIGSSGSTVTRARGYIVAPEAKPAPGSRRL